MSMHVMQFDSAACKRTSALSGGTGEDTCHLTGGDDATASETDGKGRAISIRSRKYPGAA